MIETNHDDTTIIKLIDEFLLEAIHSGASDLHFEPYEKTYQIRYRQDGVLYKQATPPFHLAPRIAARLKILARLDISERRLPQDGRFKMQISNNHFVDFRVSTCPTLFGEKIVLRILDTNTKPMDIDSLGYEPRQKELFLNAIHRSQGLILVTGPTGSGKTVSLYTGLSLLNTPERNIYTCEDPVEINLPNIHQVNVNIKAGLNFAVALRAFLRQDPDIIMIGEIRDLETASMAIKASQTGHLVLSTLHTNSAADTLTRLINMGIPAYNLATALSLIVSTRLVRCLCPFCKEKLIIPEYSLLKAGFLPEEIPSLNLFGPKGCSQCKNGYKGRTGVFEVLSISKEIANFIMAGGNAIELHRHALKEGMLDLRQSGLIKVKKGLTSLEEINTLTPESYK